MKRTLTLAAVPPILAAGLVATPTAQAQAATRATMTCATRASVTTCVTRPTVTTVRTRDARRRVVTTTTSTVRTTTSSPDARTTITRVTTTRIVGRTTRVSTRTISTHTPVTTRPRAGTPAAPVEATERRIFDLTNAERAKAGVAPFRAHASVAATAGEWSSTMARTASFTHRPDWAWARGLPGFAAAAENIFWASGNLDTLPEKAVNAWMDSPGHRANILNPSLTHLGVGVAVGAGGSLYVTQNFVGLR